MTTIHTFGDKDLTTAKKHYGWTDTYYPTDMVIERDPKNLRSLKGAPLYVAGSLIATHSRLETFEGFPDRIGAGLHINNNCFNTLHDIHLHVKQINGVLDVSGMNIVSSILGLLLIEGVWHVEMTNQKVAAIINRHIKDHDVLACQEELIDNGFEDYAEL